MDGTLDLSFEAFQDLDKIPTAKGRCNEHFQRSYVLRIAPISILMEKWVDPVGEQREMSRVGLSLDGRC